MILKNDVKFNSEVFLVNKINKFHNAYYFSGDILSIDIGYLASNVISSLLTFVIFFICFRIYSRTPGATLAYKKWAQATFIIFIAVFIHVFVALTGTPNNSTKDSAESFRIFSAFLLSLGYFYFPIGVMYLTKDMGFGDINYETIKKIRSIFLSIIISLSIFFAILVPFFVIRKVLGIISNLVFSLIWVATIYNYNKIYENLKKLHFSWTIIYIGIICAFFNDFFSTLQNILDISLIYLTITFQLLMAIALIIGFFKLAKMVEAI